MENEIKRGEVYWAQSDILGVDQKLGRPIVVVSSNKGNEVAGHVIGLFCTSSTRYGFLNVEINTPRKRTWVQCNYPATIFKERLGNYMYTLTDEEMASVDKAMMVALSLGTVAVDFEDERRSFEEEIESLNSRILAQKDSDVEVKVERDMYKRMYEKALEMLAVEKMPKIEATVVVEKSPVVKEKPPVVVKESLVSEEESRVELNTCTELDLRRIGCTPTMIHNIMAKRPYKSVDDLKKVPSITSVGYGILGNKVCCVPVVTPKNKGKVNVNTATVGELESILGLSNSTARQIVSYRKKNGNFLKIEDVTKCSRFGPVCLKKYGPKMEV